MNLVDKVLALTDVRFFSTTCEQTLCYGLSSGDHPSLDKPDFRRLSQPPKYTFSTTLQWKSMHGSESNPSILCSPNNMNSHPLVARRTFVDWSKRCSLDYETTNTVWPFWPLRDHYRDHQGVWSFAKDRQVKLLAWRKICASLLSKVMCAFRFYVLLASVYVSWVPVHFPSKIMAWEL